MNVKVSAEITPADGGYPVVVLKLDGSRVMLGLKGDNTRRARLSVEEAIRLRQALDLAIGALSTADPGV